MFYTHTTRETPNIYLWKLLLIWSHTLTHTHQESSGYVQHQASKNQQLWFPIMFHTHTTGETPNIYLWKLLLNGLIRSPTSTRRAVDMYNTRHPKITNCGFPSCFIHIQLGKHQISIYGSFFLYGLIRSPTPTRRAVDMYNTRHPKITNCGFPSCFIHIQLGKHQISIYGSFFLYGLIRSPTPTRRAVDMYNTRHPKISNCGFPSCFIHIQLGKHQISIYGSFFLMVSYAHPHPPGEQWICTTPGIQKSPTVVSHHVLYTYR